MPKKVYVALAADILPEAHKNHKKAASLGKVIVGLLTDEAIGEYKELRFELFEKTFCSFQFKVCIKLLTKRDGL